MKALLFRLDALTDIQAVEKKLMVSSCLLALVATLLSAISLWAAGPSIVIALDLAGSVVVLLQLIWIRNKNRFLFPANWVLIIMAGIVLLAVYLNGLMSVYWLYPTIVYCYFWQDIKRATIFSSTYLLLICSTVAWKDGFIFLSESRIFGAGLMTMGLMYFFSLVRDGYIEKLAQGNSEYKSYTEVLSGKVQSQFEEIRQSEERFHGIANAAQDAVVMIDDQRELTYWNPAAVRLFGYGAEEVLGRDFVAVLVPQRYRAAYQEALSKFRLTGGGPFIGRTTELTALRKDGSEFPVSLSVSALQLNQRWNAVGILRDTTERELAEAARSQLAAIVESSVVAIVGSDLKALVTSWNLGAQNVYGYTAVEMIGQAANLLVPADRQQEIHDVIEKIKLGEEVPRFETTRVRKDRSLIDVSLAFSPIRNERGELVGISAVSHDVTEIKKAERELRTVNRTLRTRSSCNLALVHAVNEIALMEEMCHVLVDVGGYRFAWVGFTQPDDANAVRPMARYGFEEGYVDGLESSWADTERGHSPWGSAIRTGTTQILQHSADESAWTPWHEESVKRGYRSIIALPLRRETEILGALTIYASDPEAFRAEEVKLITEVADDLAYGISALRTHVAQEQSVARLQESMESTISAVASMVEMRDPYTTGHQQRVAELAVTIGRAMGLPEQKVYGLHLAGIVHDLGKIHIPAEILSKPGKLTKIEYEMIKTHPEAGYEILKNVDFLWPIAQTVLQHHEHVDGSGYPAGLKGDQILLEARIIAVADVVEAISSHRPYRPALGIEAALQELQDKRGKFYDPAVVDVCVKLFSENAFSFSGKSGP
ncbi:MAG: PAS domain S-box protein [Rhodoferax sp.]|uniref:PAS domain S-box protein n=1 Tax=Rhodoferax sp. TaxID=50421 RepID=UPI002604C6AD|nr:PAS domain S-box protein [Rhodoferax sp.]MDD5335666.1 PAS domain S-box protein [Rhodoferax sp.]